MFVRNREKVPLTYRRNGYTIVLNPGTVTYVDECKVTEKELKDFYGFRVEIVGKENPVEEVAPKEAPMIKEGKVKATKVNVVAKNSLDESLLENILTEVVKENPKKAPLPKTVGVESVPKTTGVEVEKKEVKVEVKGESVPLEKPEVEVVTGTVESKPEVVTDVVTEAPVVEENHDVPKDGTEATVGVKGPVPDNAPKDDEKSKAKGAKRGAKKGTGKRGRKPKKIN